jgi:capsular exopolysaccharide synthesis family protein
MTLFDFIAPLKKWWWLLVISTLIAGGVSYFITERQPDTYQSRATLMIGQTIDDPNPSSSDLYLEQQLANNYANMANRSQVRQATMAALGLDWLPQYRVIAPPNTQLLEITVIDSVPARAQAVAQEIANQLILRSPSGENSEDQERQAFIALQLDTLQTQIQETQTEISDLQAALGELDSARDILSTQNEIAALQNKLSTLQSNYAQLLSTTQQGAVNVLSIIEAAELPTSPVPKNSLMTAGMTAAVGLALAAAGAYLIEFLDKSVKTIEEATELIQAPTIGYIPKIPKKDQPWDYVSQKPRSPITDAFRTLRTNLEFSQATRDLKTILISSPTISEGKSTIASNLARIFAQSEKKVVLIDADLRKSRVQTILEIPDHKGLSNLLANQTNVAEIIFSLNGEKLELIPSGPHPPNPTELLASQKFTDFLEQLKYSADIIIIDAPPFVVTDAAVLASKVDGVLIVVQPGQTDKSAIKDMMEQLNIIETPILGVVANRYQKKTSYYTNYYAIPLEDEEEEEE